jgi:glycosyltransferase involved in cell wall biosynthesis
VVAYQIGALAETIEDGVNGLLVEPASTLGLAKAIEHLGTSPGETQKMGLAGFKKLTGSFTTNLWLDRMENVYQSVLPSNAI